MKKLIIVLVAIIAIYSCSKSTTSTKSGVAKTPETTAATAQKVETSQVKLTPAVPTPGASESADPIVPSKAELAIKGKEVYEAKCGNCHDLKKPSAYDEVKWVKLVEWMAPRAKVAADEKELILAYVTLNAKK